LENILKVYFVGAGPGDPELLTIKAKRLMEKTEICVYAGSLINPEVLDYLPSSAEKHNSANMDLEQITGVFQRAKENNLDVIRLHTGDPSVYGAIGEQIELCQQLGIDYEVVPGVSSFSAAAAALKKELTLPDISQTVILTRAEGRTPVPPTQQLKELARTKATLVIFLSVHLIEQVVGDLLPDYGANCPVAVVYKASWKEERIIETTLSRLAEEVADKGITKTALIIVGEVLTSAGTRSKLYREDFSHGYRKEKSV
jgi:precorrin-4/cobalt-precorrin-4 C11-methyltransferase